DLAQHGIDFKDLQSSQSSLEEIFVGLIKESRA
ncbi:MAG: multidrug ABC transporter ATP-binding protein, partial [Pseudomonas sp.]|nr:multidrug ABC transporter ATP-binding protein [Pseudomonas sp.]